MIRLFVSLVAGIALLSADRAIAQGLIRAATQAKDLTFPTVASTISPNNPRMTLLKPKGPGPFPAIVLHHQCAGIRFKGRPNRSMVTWAQAAVRQGYVVLLMDSLGPRGVDLVCYGPKGDVNLARGVRDAMQAADHLRTFAFVDKKRIAHVGFSWGAMVGLLASNSYWRLAHPGGEGFVAVVSVYPGCFTIRPKTAPSFEIVQNRIDRPVLVLMGDKDTETPPGECVPKLQAAKAVGAPVEWHVFPNATHCWDCAHLNGLSKKDFRGTRVVYRYDASATQETTRRMFEFLEKVWVAAR